jgi:hypothetical protein
MRRLESNLFADYPFHPSRTTPHMTRLVILVMVPRLVVLCMNLPFESTKTPKALSQNTG